MRPAWLPWRGKTLNDLNQDDLERLKADEVSESYFIEYKSLWDPFKVARSVASFANTEGGTVVVGIDDDDMVPIAVEGITFGGNLLESLDQSVRQHITPVPMYSAVVVPLATGRVCLVVQVPSGYDTPHVLVRTGQILERSNTSSDPVPPQNRERIRELFDRGKAGKAWADQMVRNWFTSDGRPEHLKVWTIPQVDDGLNLNEILYRPSFVKAAISTTPVPFAHSSWNPRYETPGYHLGIRHSLSHDCTTELRVDGIVFTGWALLKDTQWINVRHDLPDLPVENDNFFSYKELRDHAGLILQGHYSLLHDLIGYTGQTTVLVKGIFATDQAISAYRTSVPAQALASSRFHEAIRRDFDRGLGQTVLDPED